MKVIINLKLYDQTLLKLALDKCNTNDFLQEK